MPITHNVARGVLEQRIEDLRQSARTLAKSAEHLEMQAAQKRSQVTEHEQEIHILTRTIDTLSNLTE